jgi:dihydroorotase
MPFDLLIRGGQVATGREVVHADVGVRAGKIAAVGDLGSEDAAEVIDARGLVTMPGVIDTQVHFREPGLEQKEDLESGTRAALHGGVTSILEMPNTSPLTTSKETLEDKIKRATGRAWCHFGFFVGATKENIADLTMLEGLPGTPGIKIFMGSSTGSLLVDDDDHLRQVLKNGAKRVAVHAEDEMRNQSMKSLINDQTTVEDHPMLRDAESARMATERILQLSEQTDRPVHILHVSTADELPLIDHAKKIGLRTTAEVTPQHLWFSAPNCYERLGTHAQMNPPIRTADHQQALIKAMQIGLFDVFGSDHAPHTLEEKDQKYPKSPSGMPGVQTMLPVLLTLVDRGILDLPRVVRMACENPAKLYNIANKGHLEVGYDADLVVLDLQKGRRVDRSFLQSKCGWSPWEGEVLTGWPEVVILNGQIAIRNDQRVAPAAGKILVFG